MRALADTSVARDTAGIFKGLWQGSEKECDELRAEVERLRAAGRVLVRRAESVITTDKAGNQFQHVFVDDLEALRAALEPKP
jgi:hypothetical protein